MSKTSVGQKKTIGASKKTKPVKKPAKRLSVTDKGRRPDFLTKKEAEEYIKLRKNYNAYLAKDARKYLKKYGVEDKMTREDLERAGIIGYRIVTKLGDLKDRTAFLTARKLMKSRNTKAWRNFRQEQMKMRLYTIVTEAYGASDDEKEILSALIQNMTEEELVDFYIAHKSLNSDMFLKYRRNKEMGLIEGNQASINEVMGILLAYQADRTAI
jgi:hypothetical protein